MSLVKSVAAAVVVGFMVVGCEPKPEVETYKVPKDQQEPTAESVAQENVAPAQPTPPFAGASGSGMTALPGMAAQAGAFVTPEWQAPSGWTAQPLGSIRKGSWKVTRANGTADVSVTVFPGDVGGDLANVNRWRGQIGLSPVTQDKLASEMQHLDVGDAHAHLVQLDGPKGQSILGAIVPRGGGTWFFKMQGPTSLVNTERGSFSQFLSSVSFPPAN
ncbi:MAG: hypothetical protein AAFX93_18830 [Verrucomicrobiota bacterium]